MTGRLPTTPGMPRPQGKATPPFPGGDDWTIETLVHLIHAINRLAKELPASKRNKAYAIKNEAVSSLVMHGFAAVNGIRPDGVVGLDIFAKNRSRVHVPRQALTHEAKMRVREPGASVSVVAPLSDIVRVSRLSRPVGGTTAPVH